MSKIRLMQMLCNNLLVRALRELDNIITGLSEQECKFYTVLLRFVLSPLTKVILRLSCYELVLVENPFPRLCLLRNQTLRELDNINTSLSEQECKFSTVLLEGRFVLSPLTKVPHELGLPFFLLLSALPVVVRGSLSNSFVDSRQPQ